MTKAAAARTLAAFAALAMTSACTVNRDARAPATSQVTRDAALQPLNDVGAVKPEIDPELERILEDPYALGAGATECGELQFEITKLNRILGPDYDVQIELDKDTDRTQRGIGIAGRMAAGLLIPFRGVVREISGASSAEREFRAALIAGIARRSYLKGIAKESDCPLPPDPYVEAMKAEAAARAAEEENQSEN